MPSCVLAKATLAARDTCPRVVSVAHHMSCSRARASVVPVFTQGCTVFHNTFQPSRDPSTGWRCHFAAGAIPTSTRISASRKCVGSHSSPAGVLYALPSPTPHPHLRTTRHRPLLSCTIAASVVVAIIRHLHTPNVGPGRSARRVLPVLISEPGLAKPQRAGPLQKIVTLK